jgi:hypothetical protein
MTRERKMRAPSWSDWLPTPWGRALEHGVGTFDLLRLPLVFGQSRLLDPGDFVKEAEARGVRELRVEFLHELHRQRVLVPFFQLLQRPRRSGNSVLEEPLPELDHARGPFRDVLVAADQHRLIDPSAGRVVPWLPHSELALSNAGVYYSEHQLLGVEALQRAVAAVNGTLSAERNWVMVLEPPRPMALEDLRRGRDLAIVLAAIDSHYLPDPLRGGLVSR